MFLKMFEMLFYFFWGETFVNKRFPPNRFALDLRKTRKLVNANASRPLGRPFQKTLVATTFCFFKIYSAAFKLEGYCS